MCLYYDAKKELGYKGIMKKEKATTVLLSSIPKNEETTAYLYEVSAHSPCTDDPGTSPAPAYTDTVGLSPERTSNPELMASAISSPGSASINRRCHWMVDVASRILVGR